jgi:hypothetical protein
MKEFKKDFKATIQSTILRKYGSRVSDVNHFHRKRNLGALKIEDVNRNDYIEEFGMRWYTGYVLCRVFPNKKEVIIWTRMLGYNDNVGYSYKKTADELICNRKEIREMIKGVINKVLINSNFN